MGAAVEVFDITCLGVVMTARGVVVARVGSSQVGLLAPFVQQ